jgi:hypothetical protein
MKSAWITYKGKEIIYCDYSHLAGDELQQEVDEVDTGVCERPPHSVLGLVNVTGVLSGFRPFEILQKSMARVKPYVRRTAVVGLGNSVVRKTMFDLVAQIGGQQAKAFETIEEAKEWLVAE